MFTRLPRSLFRLTAVWAALILVVLAGSGQAGPVLGEFFDQTYPIDPGSKISIRNNGGSIMVYGTATNELTISALKRAYSAARLAKISVNVAVKPGEVVIDTQFPPQPRWGLRDRSGTVEYVITVPWSCSALNIDLADGEVLLEGVRGGVTKANLGNGRLFVKDCFTDLRIGINRGGFDGIWTWWERTKFSLNAMIGHGNTRLQIPRDASFRLLGSSDTGRIFTDFPAKRSKPEDDSKIDTLVGGESQTEIVIKNTTGNIEVIASNP